MHGKTQSIAKCPGYKTDCTTQENTLWWHLLHEVQQRAGGPQCQVVRGPEQGALQLRTRCCACAVRQRQAAARVVEAGLRT